MFLFRVCGFLFPWVLPCCWYGWRLIAFGDCVYELVVLFYYVGVCFLVWVVDG